ncbi:MAG: phosphatase PAP2 family protein [Anaerolineales bacterium]|jgi:membrane-associated phospholipid phosphatase
MSSILQWGAQIVRQAQSLGPGLLLPAQAITLLGSEQFFLFLVTLIYWCLDASLGIRLAFLLVSVDGLTGCLKLAFHMPRPYWYDPAVRALSTETSYGLPSGHASASSAVAIFLAQRVRRWWAWVLGGVLLLAISWTRIYLGVHFPTDVVAGWVVGAVTWLVFIWFLPRVGAWISQANLVSQLALALAGSLVVLVFSGGILWAIASQVDPPQWAVTARRAAGGNFENPRSPDDLISEAGLLLGLGTGAVLSRRCARYQAGGRVDKRVLRYLVGMAGILLWEVGLPRLLAGVPAWNGLTVLYLRSAITGFWAVFLAPVIFLWLGLAEQAA